MGQDGGTARGDAILRQENIEFGEGVVDPFDGLQGFTNVAETGGEVGGYRRSGRSASMVRWRGQSRELGLERAERQRRPVGER